MAALSVLLLLLRVLPLKVQPFPSSHHDFTRLCPPCSIRRVIFDFNFMFVVRKNIHSTSKWTFFRILIAYFKVILRRSVRGILHAWTAHKVSDELKKTRVLIKVEKLRFMWPRNSTKIDKFLSWFNCSSHQLASPAGFRSTSDLRVRGSWRWETQSRQVLNTLQLPSALHQPHVHTDIWNKREALNTKEVRPVSASRTHKKITVITGKSVEHFSVLSVFR